MSGFCAVLVSGAALSNDGSVRVAVDDRAVIHFPCAVERRTICPDGSLCTEVTRLSCTVFPSDQAQGKCFLDHLLKGQIVSFQGRLMPDPKTGTPRLWEGQHRQFHSTFEILIDPSTLHFSLAEPSR